MGGDAWRVHMVPKEGQRFQRVYGEGAETFFFSFFLKNLLF